MKLRIGTRSSPLALVQAKMVENRIKAAYPKTETEIIATMTKGDRNPAQPITALGGHGVFVTEMEEALLNSTYDIAVHSAKDLPPRLLEGLEISGVLPRGDYREAVITRRGETVVDDPAFIVGTGSVRRRLNMQRLYPSVGFRSIRGGVDKRMEKLLAGEYDALILAMAGLERLGFLTDSRFEITPYAYTEFIPPPSQGIIAIESRVSDLAGEIIKKISDRDTFASFESEYAVVELLSAECETPLGAYSFVDRDEIALAVCLGNEKMISDTYPLKNRLALARDLVNQL